MTDVTPKPSLRILYVTNNFPYPLATGLLRHYHLLEQLSRRHAVTLLSIVGSDFAPENEDALASVTERILTFPRRSSRLGRGLTRIRLLLPGSRTRTPAGRLGQAATGLIARERFDAVLFSGKATHPALRAFDKLPVVIDMCDTGSSRVLGNLRYAPARRLPLLLLEYVEMRRAERLLAEKGDYLLFASARDRDLLFERHADLRERVPVGVLPNGVDLEYWRRTGSELGDSEVVFHGSMNWPPNEDAALHLIREVMPLVWRSHPDARLSIVGRSAGRAIHSAAADPRVLVTGAVADVRPYLERASVFAAPLRFGAGIQNKVLEAMAMEVPSIVSPLAAAGVRSDDGRDPPVAVASAANEFAAGLVELLAAARRDPVPDHAARRYVEECFAWERSGQLLAEILEYASEANGGRRAAAGRVDRPDGVAIRSGQ
jgi:polysaccharide biosynthesis protein PslH